MPPPPCVWVRFRGGRCCSRPFGAFDPVAKWTCSKEICLGWLSPSAHGQELLKIPPQKKTSRATCGKGWNPNYSDRLHKLCCQATPIHQPRSPQPDCLSQLFMDNGRVCGVCISSMDGHQVKFFRCVDGVEASMRLTMKPGTPIFTAKSKMTPLDKFLKKMQPSIALSPFWGHSFDCFLFVWFIKGQEQCLEGRWQGECVGLWWPQKKLFDSSRFRSLHADTLQQVQATSWAMVSNAPTASSTQLAGERLYNHQPWHST